MLTTFTVRAVQQDDEDTARGFCHLFTDMAETYLPMVLEGDSATIPLVEVVLECTSHPDVSSYI